MFGWLRGLGRLFGFGERSSNPSPEYWNEDYEDYLDDDGYYEGDCCPDCGGDYYDCDCLDDDLEDDVYYDEDDDFYDDEDDFCDKCGEDYFTCDCEENRC